MFRRKKDKKGVRRFWLVLLAAVLFLSGGVWVKNGRAQEPPSEPSWSWTLGGRNITIDAGHGGIDPGTIGLEQTLEKEINLAIAKRLQALFVQAGCNVTMIRDDDVDYGGETGSLLERKRQDLAYRIQTAVDSQADIYFSIHSNSFPNSAVCGPQVFYHRESASGRALATYLQDQLNLLVEKKREAKDNQSYYVLKNADMTSVTVEVGFLSNPEEEKKLNDPLYQEKVAMAIFEGTIRYIADETTGVTNSK